MRIALVEECVLTHVIGQAEAFLDGGECEGVGRRDQGREFVLWHGAEDDRFDAEFGGALLPAGSVVAVVEQGLAAGDDEPMVRVVGVEQGVCVEEVDRALPGFDAADGQHVAAEPFAPVVLSGPVLGRGGEAFVCHAVGDHPRRDTPAVDKFGGDGR